MATTTDLEKLVINYLTQDQYDDAREAGTLNANELYLTPDTGSTNGTVTSIATGGGLTGGPITSSGTISHDDTSSQSSISNSGRTYIQSVTLDTYGHVTGLSSATETVTDTHHQAYLYDTTSNGTIRVTTDTSDPYLTLVENSTARSRVQLKASTGISISANNGVVTFTNTSTNTDENLKWTASTSSNTYYPLQSTSTATTSTANTLNGISFYQYYNTAGGYRRLDLGNSTAYKSTGGAYGTIRLYGAAATYYGDLVPGVLGTTSGDGHLTANRTWTLPNATGTIALTSDIPDVSSFITDAGVTKITTTAGTHSAITNATGAVSFNVPTKTSHLTNDSNFVTSSGVTSITLKAGSGISLDTDNTAITTTGTRTISHADTSSQASSSNSGRTYIQSITLDTYGHVTGISTATETVTNTDENVKSTAVTAATTNYIVGSTTSTTTTGGLSKHASAVLYTTADSGTSGYTQLRLGNTTATSSAGGKEGQIRLYGTTATYYVDLKAGAPSANRTITFPNKTGTVALTSDIPSYTDTNTTYSLSGALSSHKFTSTLTAGGSGSGTSTSDFTLAAGTGITITDDTSNRKMTITNIGVVAVEASPASAENGTVAVTKGTSDGSSTSYVAVKGLAAAAYKGVTDNSNSTAVTSSDTNLITARTLYYAGYTKNTGTITGVSLDGTSLATSGIANIPVFGVSTQDTAGTTGLVPAPRAGEGQANFLSAIGRYEALDFLDANNNSILKSTSTSSLYGVTYSFNNATTSIGGLMSSADKTKLNNIQNIITNASSMYSTSGIISYQDWLTLPHLTDDTSYNNATISAGNTSTTYTLSAKRYRTKILDVYAYDATTYDPIIVDWSPSAIDVYQGTITVTISIAQAYEHSISCNILYKEFKGM